MRCILVLSVALCLAVFRVPATALEYQFRGELTNVANIDGYAGDFFDVHIPYFASLVLGEAEGEWTFGFADDPFLPSEWGELGFTDYGDRWPGGPGANRNEIIDTPASLTVDFYLQTGEINGFYRGLSLSLDKNSSNGTWEWGNGIICAACDSENTDPYAAAVIREFRIVPESLEGDFNNDGTVDGMDFLTWQRDPSIGTLSDWQTSYGAVSGSPAAGSSTVPEPSAFLLTVLAICFDITSRRRLEFGTL